MEVITSMLLVRNSGASEMIHWMTHSYCLENVNDQPNDPHSSLYIVTLNAPPDDPQFFYYKGEGPSKRPTCYFSVRADHDLLKSVWECSEMKVSQWKILHPSDTEDEQNVGISSEDEAEGLEAAPGVARHGSGRPAALEAQPALVLVQPQVAEDEVVVKKRALKRMKQQVSALLLG